MEKNKGILHILFFSICFWFMLSYRFAIQNTCYISAETFVSDFWRHVRWLPLMWNNQTYRNECMKKSAYDEDIFITSLSTKVQPFKNLLFTEVSDRTTSVLAWWRHVLDADLRFESSHLLRRRISRLAVASSADSSLFTFAPSMWQSCRWVFLSQ